MNKATICFVSVEGKSETRYFLFTVAAADMHCINTKLVRFN